MSDEIDICRNRHRDNPQSMFAFDDIRATLPARREQVRKAIEASGEAGATVHEIAERWGTHPNNISGRFTELKKGDLIEQIGRRKTPSGSLAGVYRLRKITNDHHHQG